VSVIVPIYNGDRYLDDALRSIIEQNYRPVEIIVVDDGSTDDSAVIAQSYKEVRYVHQINQGPSAARNKGIEAARGELIAFLDADDIWMPNKLAIQVNYLREHPEVEFVVAHRRMLVEEGIEKPPWYREDIFEKNRVCLGPSAMLARRNLFEEVGRYDPKYRTGEIAEWLTRVKGRGVNYVILPETLLTLRVHGGNLTYQLDEMRSNILTALKASLDRQRSSGD
jgi:glycosyltransferase involved in cell wall biosynthesis